jgi:hypothetical protein
MESDIIIMNATVDAEFLRPQRQEKGLSQGWI